MHTVFARRTRLWLIARAPGLPLGGISGLNLDRSESRKSIASLFRLFKSIFEAVLPFFWWSEGLASKALPPGPPNLPQSNSRSSLLHAKYTLIEAWGTVTEHVGYQAGYSNTHSRTLGIRTAVMPFNSLPHRSPLLRVWSEIDGSDRITGLEKSRGPSDRQKNGNTASKILLNSLNNDAI